MERNATGDPRTNLIKLCVGAESVESLVAWRASRAAEQTARGLDPRMRHVTRTRPKNAEGILAARGSLYWVIGGMIQARQRIEAFEPVEGDDGITRCAIVFDPVIVRTELRPRRAFQGWRYLTAADAPPDLAGGAEAIAEMPADLRAELARLGVL